MTLRSYRLHYKIARQGLWQEKSEVARVKELYKINIGIVGAGHVGRHMIKLLKKFDAGIFFYDPFITKEEAAKLDNVVVTPHLAGAFTNNRFRQGVYAVTELERFFFGEKPLYPVTKSTLNRVA